MLEEQLDSSQSKVFLEYFECFISSIIYAAIVK